MLYLSLWPLLQSLQERSDIIIVINDELHVLPHNTNGNILKEWKNKPKKQPANACLYNAQMRTKTTDLFCAGTYVAAGHFKQEWRELRYLGGEVLLAWEGFSESTEAMLDQVVQITWAQNNHFLKQSPSSSHSAGGTHRLSMFEHEVA